MSRSDISLRTIMSDALTVRTDHELAGVVRLMIGKRVGCLPVVDERRRPIGIITKTDLLEQLDAALRDELAAKTAGDVMMPLAVTLHEHTTLAEAVAKMLQEDTHHIMVVGDSGALTGVVSSKDLVRWAF